MPTILKRGAYLNKLALNIKLYYWYVLCFGLILTGPIYQVFLLNNKLSIFQISLLGAWFGLLIILLEIPSGVLADRWSKKGVLIISAASFIVANLLYALGQHFWLFLVAETFVGITFAMHSGTINALVYESLSQTRKNLYPKVRGTGDLIQYGVLIAAGIAGAWIAANYNFRLTFLITAGFAVLALFIATKFTEPKNLRKEISHWAHTREAIQYAFQQPPVRFIMIFSALIWCSLGIALNYMQIYQLVIGIPIIYFGFISGGRNLLNGVAARYGYIVKKYLTYRSIFTIMLASAIILTYLASKFHSVIGIVIFLLLALIMGITIPIGSLYAQAVIRSDHRATVEGIGNVFAGLVMLILEPLFGKIAETYSIFTAYNALSAFFLIYAVYYFIFEYRKIKT